MKLTFAVVLSLISTTVLASADFDILAQVQKLDSGGRQLVMKLTDTQAKAGVCTYYVRSHLYIEAISTLSLELFKEPCLNDLYGKSTGEFYWSLPAHLTVPGKRVCLLVDNKIFGTIAYDGQAQNFLAIASETCK